MTAYPLEAALSSLSPARRVYEVRRGLVFLYPASIVSHAVVTSPLYTMDDDRPWCPTPGDWCVGRLLASRLALDQVDHVQLRSLARTAWRNAGQNHGDSAFYLWWDSVNPDAHPEWIGAAACVAAREFMTLPLFQHRHMVDAPQMRA